VLFDFDKYTLRPAANESLMKVGQVASGYPDAPLLIEGHTDSKGSHAYNMTLSDNRAGAVKKWLVENGGIKASRITTKGWGETKPVAPNKKPDGSDDLDGRQKNRRVELTLTVATREHNSPSPITSVDPGPHSLRISAASGPHYVRTDPHYPRMDFRIAA
jgi:outer membrane protein OmpA-like peptidoglycan-associated protein